MMDPLWQNGCQSPLAMARVGRMTWHAVYEGTWVSS
jgi:hypothetical protein